MLRVVVVYTISFVRSFAMRAAIRGSMVVANSCTQRLNTQRASVNCCSNIISRTLVAEASSEETELLQSLLSSTARQLGRTVAEEELSSYAQILANNWSVND